MADSPLVTSPAEPSVYGQRLASGSPFRNVRRKDLARETPEVPIIAEQSAALKTNLWLCGSYSKGQNAELLSSPGSFVFLSAVLSLAGSVRTLIALHHGRKTTMNMKSELFASCRGRVNVSGGSEIAWMNVECNGDSLSVVVPSKVKKCYSSVTNSLLGGNWRDSERIETAALPKNLFIWQQLHLQPMAVWIILNSRVI